MSVEEEEVTSEEFGSLRHVSFNQDGSHFVVLSKRGIHVFSVDPFEKKYDRKAKEVSLVVMVYNTNYLGYVTHNKFHIFDIKKKTVLCEIPECREITGLKFTRKFFILVFSDEADVYDRNDMDKKYWTIKTVSKNFTGVSATSIDNDLFCVPAEKIGEVMICDLLRKEVKTVKAHRNPIQCLALNPDGGVLATCSNNGKNIKLYDTKDGKDIRNVRRGSSAREMYSIAFSGDTKYLCCYSSSGTVHQFSVDGKGENRTTSLRGLSYLGFSYFGSEWSKAEMRLKEEDKGVCTFDPKNNDILNIITTSGQYTKLDFSKEDPKERTQIKNLYTHLKPSEEVRKNESKRIIERFPERVPVMLDIKKECKLPRLPKRKYLVPKALSVGNFSFSIAKKMNLQNQSLKFYVGENEVLLSEVEDSLTTVYEKYQNSDGFLYMKYSD